MQFASRAQFDRAVRQAIIDINAGGPVFCDGHPQAAIRANYSFKGFREKGCTFGCCRCGECRTTITGNLAKWPAWAPWRGPAENLRESFTPEELVEFADRYVADWGGDPPDPSKADPAAVLLPLRGVKGRWSALRLPDLPPAETNEFARWLEPVRWKVGQNGAGAWRALRRCKLAGEARLDTGGNFIPLCVSRGLESAYLRMGTDRTPHRWEGGTLVHEIALVLEKGDCLFFGTWGPNPAKFRAAGEIRLAVDRPDAPEKTEEAPGPRRRPYVWKAHADLLIRAEEQYETPDGDPLNADKRYPQVDHGLGGKRVPPWAERAISNDWGTAWWVDTEPGERLEFVPPDVDLDRRLQAAKRDVTRDEALAAWKASSAGKLELMFGGTNDYLRQVMNLHGANREEEREFEYSPKLHALPESLWRELLELSLVDRAGWHEGYYTCGDFTFDLKAELRQKWGINGAAFVADLTSAPHAYVALLAADGDGSPRWLFIEPQDDGVALKKSFFYGRERGFAVI